MLALGASLAAYVAVWIGDVVHGVLAAVGAPQVIILTKVVVIADLFAISRHSAAMAKAFLPIRDISRNTAGHLLQFMLILDETAEDFARRNDPAQAGDPWGGWTAFMGVWRRRASS